MTALANVLIAGAAMAQKPALPPAPLPPVLFPPTATPRPPAPAAPAQIPATPAPLAAPTPPQPGPWKILFDGGTITGLRGVQKPDFLKAGWKLEDGALVMTKEIKQSGKQTGGDLMTIDAFVDFEFSFEWKLNVSGDSGVLYMARGSGGKVAGHEFQIIDDVRNPDGLKGGPIKRTGGLYGVLPPGETHLNDGAWNEGAITVQGNHVEHYVNREKVLEYELGSIALQKAVMAAKAKVPMGFGTKARAPIMLLDQGEDISFRHIRIRALPPAAPAVAGATR